MEVDIKMYAEMIDAYRDAGQLPMLAYAFISSVVLAFGVLAIFFLLQAIGLYRINRRLGNKLAWLAFIPGLSGYALGSVADALQKKKPSNYCIHMLMLNLFSLVLNAVNYVYIGGRFVFLYEKLSMDGEIDTVALLQRVLTVGREDEVLYLTNLALSIFNYVFLFFTFLCTMRILQLFRRGGFFLLLCTLFLSQVMSIYLFVMRNKPIYRKLPMIHMPDGTTFDPSSGDFESNNDGEDQNDENGGDDRDDSDDR